MATVKKLSRLFRALSDQSLSSAAQVADEIITEAETKGHRTAAKVLKGSLRPNGRPFSRHGVESRPVLATTILPTALVRLNGPARLSDVQLRQSAKSAVDDLLGEWKYSNVLRDAGIGRRTKVAFFGPPGCGKSLTALAIGNEIKLPVYLVRFDAVIGAYLGQTAIHLRELFQFAASTPCILLFDEIDALARKRGNPSDVGELDRIVIAFMQELEHSTPQGFIIATSNLPKHLDAAVWRRFDLAIEFSRPNRAELRRYIASFSRSVGVTLSAGTRAILTRTNSYAEAEAAIRSEARRKLIRQQVAKNGKNTR